MDQRKAILVVSVVVLLILFIVGGTIFYLARVFNSGKSSANRVVTSSSSPAPVSTDNQTPLPTTATNQPTNNSSSVQQTASALYNGNSFSFKYPKAWGLLTCSNSQNIELDPYNSSNSRIACDFAVKPVTVLVNKNTCRGGTVTNINGISVTKVIERTDTGVDYQWCTQSNPPLDISHRVSSDGSRATSIGDFSFQVEQIISSLSFAR